MGRSKKRLVLRRGSRSVLVLAAALASSAVACAGILGLDEFDKGECAGARCGDGAPPPDVIVPDAPIGPDGGDGGLEGSVGTDPTTWAKWVMPNYDLPDGATGPGRALEYSPRANDEVFDVVTQLTWKRAPSGQEDIVDAKTLCDGIEKSGPKWRVPKRIELVTILDYGAAQPPFVRKGAAGFDPNKFPNGVVWTSSEELTYELPSTSLKRTGRYWAVNFSTGKLVTMDGMTSNSVLCVKGL